MLTPYLHQLDGQHSSLTLTTQTAQSITAFFRLKAASLLIRQIISL